MLAKISFHINRWVEYTLFSLGMTMTFTVALQVFFRYVLNQSLFWSEELARFLLIWLTFLGASCAYCRQVNPGVDVLFAKLPQTFRKILSSAVHLISLLFFSIMILYGYQFAFFVRAQISPALQVPKWTIMIIVPVSGLIMAVHGLNFLVKELKGPDDR